MNVWASVCLIRKGSVIVLKTQKTHYLSYYLLWFFLPILIILAFQFYIYNLFHCQIVCLLDFPKKYLNLLQFYLY